MRTGADARWRFSPIRHWRIFGPDSRAEVPILAKARQKDRDVLIAGRIDRLVVTTSA